MVGVCNLNGLGDIKEKPPLPLKISRASKFSKKMQFAEKYRAESKKLKNKLPLKSKVKRGFYLAFFDISSIWGCLGPKLAKKVSSAQSLEPHSTS